MGNQHDSVVAVDQEYRGCRFCLGWELYQTSMGLEDVKAM